MPLFLSFYCRSVWNDASKLGFRCKAACVIAGQVPTGFSVQPDQPLKTKPSISAASAMSSALSTRSGDRTTASRPRGTRRPPPQDQRLAGAEWTPCSVMVRLWLALMVNLTASDLARAVSLLRRC
jgi:hypothetical protein